MLIYTLFNRPARMQQSHSKLGELIFPVSPLQINLRDSNQWLWLAVVALCKQTSAPGGLNAQMLKVCPSGPQTLGVPQHPSSQRNLCIFPSEAVSSSQLFPAQYQTGGSSSVPSSKSSPNPKPSTSMFISLGDFFRRFIEHWLLSR